MTDFLGSSRLTACKAYRCDSCGGVIDRGTTFVRQLFQDGLGGFGLRAHLHCFEAAELLSECLPERQWGGEMPNVCEFTPRERDYVRLVRPDLAAKLWPAEIAQRTAETRVSAPAGGLSAAAAFKTPD